MPASRPSKSTNGSAYAEGVALGIIGGSGVYEIDGLRSSRWEAIDTPWGHPSDELLLGDLDGNNLVFLPRHGRGHRIPPNELNFRANIAALKLAGATSIVSLSAVGSLRDNIAPGEFVVVDQFIDRTRQRVGSFFGTGCVAHISMAQPVCTRLADATHRALGELGARVHRGGTYVVMEGPQFSTQAESHWYRSMDAAVIGMTNQPEAKLAREAELCYATVAMVTDYDCWHPHHDAVTVDQVVRILQANATTARSLVGALARSGVDSEADCPAGCSSALDHAIMTTPSARDPDLVALLSGPRGVASRVLANPTGAQ